MKRATIYSIASDLGVSPSTVSRSFSRPELVRRDLREAVLTKAAEVQYFPNRAARGLATGRTGLFGVLVPDLTNPFIPPLVRAIQRAAHDEDAELLLVDEGDSNGTATETIHRVLPHIDGLIIASPTQPSSRLLTFMNQVPSVLINAQIKGVPHVVCDNSNALQSAADHLYELGHRRFAVLVGPSDSWAAARRVQAVQDWAEDKCDLEVVTIGPLAAQFDDGRAAAPLIANAEATAIFAFDDLMAAGVVAGLDELNEDVPSDRSIVGCDDVLIAKTMTPALTTITAPVDELGAHAVRLLKARISNMQVESVILYGELTIRGTTGRVR